MSLWSYTSQHFWRHNTGDEGINCCAKFIDVYGLRSLFPCFMKTPGKKVKRGKLYLLVSRGPFPETRWILVAFVMPHGVTESRSHGVTESQTCLTQFHPHVTSLTSQLPGGFSELEWVEHVSSIISHLLRNSSGSQLQRLMNKFVEDDHLKVSGDDHVTARSFLRQSVSMSWLHFVTCFVTWFVTWFVVFKTPPILQVDRLIELHLFYLIRATMVDREIEEEKENLGIDGDEVGYICSIITFFQLLTRETNILFSVLTDLTLLDLIRFSITKF